MAEGIALYRQSVKALVVGFMESLQPGSTRLQQASTIHRDDIFSMPVDPNAPPRLDLQVFTPGADFGKTYYMVDYDPIGSGNPVR